MTTNVQSNGRRRAPAPVYRERPFALSVDLAALRVVLSVRQAEAHMVGTDRSGPRQIAVLQGRRAEALLPLVMEFLHKAGASLPRAEERGTARMRLPEPLGARLALLLWAVAPIQKPSRAGLIRAGILAMSDEEVYYWYARGAGGPAVGDRQRRSNALKALRILLSGE